MGAHNDLQELRRLYEMGEAGIVNPGASGTFNLQGKTMAVVTVTATGNYTLPNAAAGTTLLVVCDDTSTVTLKNSAGTTVGVFTGTTGTTGMKCESLGGANWTTKKIDASTSATGDITAAEVSIADAGGYTDAGDLESLTQAMLAYLTAYQYNTVGVPLGSFREVDSNGDVANAAGNGGLLASDTTPIYLADAAEALCIQWAANNADIIAASVPLPGNFDGTQNVTIVLLVQMGGTTDTASMTVNTNWDGGTQVVDTATGTTGTSKQYISATVAAADVLDDAKFLSLQLVPGSHANDTLTLYGVQVRCGAGDINVA